MSRYVRLMEKQSYIVMVYVYLMSLMNCIS